MDSETWTAACARLRDELGWVRTSPWLDELALRSVDGAQAIVEAGDAGTRDKASANAAAIGSALAEVLRLPAPPAVRVAVRRRAQRAELAPAAREPQGGGAAAGGEVDLGPDTVNAGFQLSSFLTGPSNEVPLRFAREVIERPGQWHPVVFHGGSGSGKTHLLQAIANGYRRRYPGRRVVYASSERFARQYSFTARHRLAGRFRELYREADLLVLDDLQDLAGKQGTERELTFTLDHLQSVGRQVVLASASAPKRVALDPSLADRLVGGVVLELKAPDRDTRLAIIKARAAALALSLDEQVVELLLGALPPSIRELLCAINQLDAHRRLVGGRLDVDVARKVLADLLKGRLEPASLEALCQFVAGELVLDPALLKGQSRRPHVARARIMAMALGRELTPLTLREIGAFFGQRACASVHGAQDRAAELCADDPRLRALWDAACGRFARATR